MVSIVFGDRNARDPHKLTAVSNSIIASVLYDKTRKEREW